MNNIKPKFKNGTFKIMQIADVQDIFPVSDDSVKLLALALQKEKPDLAVFTGDQIYGLDPRMRIGNTRNKVEAIIAAYLAPLCEAHVPFCVTFGNHDAQCGISDSEQYEIYKKYPGFVEGIALPDTAGCTAVPIFDETGEKCKFELFLFNSGGQSPTGEYFPVDDRQLRWYEEIRRTEKQNGEDIPHIVFQHIPVPEYYNVLKKVARTEKGAVEAFRTHKNEFYVLPDNITDGFMHESPAVPDKNSGEFDILKNDGNCLAIAVGHDHINSFVAELDGVKLIYTQCAGFNVYGPKKQRGVRIFELNESDLSKFETHTATFESLCGDKLQKPLKEFVLTHIPTSMEQVKRIAAIGIAGVTSAAAAAIVAAKVKKKHFNRTTK